MPGKEDGPSSTNGPAKAEDKPVDKGKGKAVDAEEQKKEPKRDKDGKIIEDDKLLPPGMAENIKTDRTRADHPCNRGTK